MNQSINVLESEHKLFLYILGMFDAFVYLSTAFFPWQVSMEIITVLIFSNKLIIIKNYNRLIIKLKHVETQIDVQEKFREYIWWHNKENHCYNIDVTQIF